MTIIMYDIVDNARRVKVATTLEEVGDRIQDSVFAVRLSLKAKNDLMSSLYRIIDVSADSVYFADQCGVCWDKLAILGSGKMPGQETHWAVM